MPNHHHKRSAQVEGPESLETALAAIEAFVASCRAPAVLEYGDEVIPLKTGEYTLEIRSGRLWVDAWHDTRSLSRRILSVDSCGTGTLDCSVHRFGGAPGKLTFLDLDRPQTAHRRLSGARQTFAEQFRRMLTRQFPGWVVDTLSTGMDLQRSFSPVFPRARLIRGSQQIAAMACADIVDECGFLTFALLWFDYLKTRNRGMSTRLALFVPDAAGALTAHRLRWLDQNLVRSQMFRYNEHGSAGEVDPEDLGNVDTRVSEPAPFPNELRHGMLNADEQVLELIVKANANRLDADLLLHAIHRQVITFSGMGRDIVDLLGICRSGQLCVIELKATEDIQLPMQGLDYWVRTMWHAQRGELSHLFPGAAIRPDPPRLLLVAPALSFHPQNTTVLRYFQDGIDVERIGVNSNWQKELRVVLRLKGADVPQSHGRTYEHNRQPDEHKEGYLEAESGPSPAAE